MDKNSIKKFAVEARQELIKRVSQRAAFYGITKEDYGDPKANSVQGYVLSEIEKEQRQKLISKIRSEGYEQVMEEVAYTWFNRFCALRFMEVNGYLPSRVRVFTDNENTFSPQILKEAIDMDLDGLDMKKVHELKVSADKDEELFKYLIITQCNALNAILPKIFEKIADFTELLFPDNLLREGSVIDKMIKLIPEDNWTDQVEIIGWLYQYYNTKQNELVYDGNMSKSRIPKELLPAATTIYTPHWAVCYMVENSLGRLWLEGHPNDKLKSGWTYYLEEAEQPQEVEHELAMLRKESTNLTPEQIKVIDPCMGSGHILTYIFDVLMKIYESCGYTTHQAIVSIIENNIYGLDIDNRATQLAYFSIMMKAREYDKRFLNRKDENRKPSVPQPHIYAILESGANKDGKRQWNVDQDVLHYFIDNRAKLKIAVDSLMNALFDAKEYGSILDTSKIDFSTLYARIDEIKKDIHIHRDSALESILPLIQVAEVIAKKYDIVITNPPYLGSSRFSHALDKYIRKNYANEKSDLSMAMYKRSMSTYCKPNGFVAFITTSSWMFLSSFAKIREYINNFAYIVNLVDFGTELFDGKVGHNPIVAWVTRTKKLDYTMSAVRLVDYCYSQRDKKKSEFFEQRNRYTAKQSDFSKIPGSPVAYWVSEKMLFTFENYKKLGEIARPRVGQNTGDNNRFLRLWYEVNCRHITFNLEHKQLSTGKYKWIPYNKGGDYRRWYGNQEYVINWEDDGREIKEYAVFRNHGKHWSRYIQNIENMCKPGVTWSFVTSGSFSVRYLPTGFICDVAGSAIFPQKSFILGLTAICNSKIATKVLDVLNPTINMQASNVASIPVDEVAIMDASILQKAQDCINLSRFDWDSFETSWDFKKHPLVRCKSFSPEEVEEDAKHNIVDMNYIREAFTNWSNECYLRFYQLKANEEELNRIFIDIYGLQDELTPEVEDKDVTVRKADLQRDIRSLISYAVGCMFGRYSLDVDGLAYAGGQWDASKYVTFQPDQDAIIPICDDEYFDDDITGRFVKWVEIVYGKQTLEENLEFIADALGGKGSPRESIRRYFINDFYKDHCKIYQKRPIYWLFSSGKKNGFQCLIYMHRYQPDTIARIRTDYVHEQQSRYRTAIADLQNRINNASTSERIKLNKSLKKLQDQSAEIHSYEEKIHHLADQMISIDLDDGVKKNYAKFQDVLAKIK